MIRKSTSILILVATAALVLAVAGCGGGGKKSAGTTQAATTEAVPTTAAPEPTTAAPTTAPATTAAPPTTAPAKTTGGSDFASAANCKQFTGLSQSFAAAFTGAGGTDLEKVAAAFKEFAAKAPQEIRADFQVIADAYAKIADALKGVDVGAGKTPSPAVLKKLQKLGTEIDQAALAAASQHISAWVAKNCHG